MRTTWLFSPYGWLNLYVWISKEFLILKYSVVIRICLNAGHSMSFFPLTWWVLSFLENVFEFCVFFIYCIGFPLRNTNYIYVGSPLSALHIYIFSWTIFQSWFFYLVSYLFSSLCPHMCYYVFSQVYTLLCCFQCGLQFCNRLIFFNSTSFLSPASCCYFYHIFFEILYLFCFPVKAIPSLNCFSTYLLSLLFYTVVSPFLYFLVTVHRLLAAPFRWLVILKVAFLARARSSFRLSCLGQLRLQLLPLQILSASSSGFLMASTHRSSR